MLGIRATAPDDETAQLLSLSAEERGPIVAEVNPGGPAWEELSDATRGGPDVILAVEGKRVQTPAELRAAIAAFKPGDIVETFEVEERERTL